MRIPEVFVSFAGQDESYFTKLENIFKKINKPERKAELCHFRGMKTGEEFDRFMKTISEKEFAVLLISDDFLKSENCMTEVYYLLNQKKDWISTTVPILLPRVDGVNGVDTDTLFAGFTARSEGKANTYTDFWVDKIKGKGSLNEKVNMSHQSTRLLLEQLEKVLCPVEDGFAQIVELVYEYHLAQCAKIFPERNGIDFEQAFSETTEIKAMGMACRHICTSANNIRRYLEEGKRLRLIIWDPLCLGAIQRAIDEHGDYGNPKTTFDNIKSSFDQLLQGIKEFKEENPKRQVELELRLQTSQPTLTCTITDEYVFFNHYGKAALGLELPAYQISKKGQPKVYDDYAGQFERYWDTTSHGNTFDFSQSGTMDRWTKRMEMLDSVSTSAIKGRCDYIREITDNVPFRGADGSLVTE